MANTSPFINNVKPSSLNENMVPVRAVDVLVSIIDTFVALTVFGNTCSLNVMVGVIAVDTPVDPDDGFIATTEGGVVSGRAATVNIDIKGEVMAFPARSLT